MTVILEAVGNLLVEGQVVPVNIFLENDIQLTPKLWPLNVGLLTNGKE